jgi:hypothetical protein
MNIRLIIADLDGTLLNSGKEIHPEFWAVHRLLTEKGILFGIASGRPLCGLDVAFSTIGDEALFIAGNGTIVQYKGEVVYENALDLKSAARFVLTAREIDGAEIIFCGRDVAYVESTDRIFLDEVAKYYSRIEVVKDLTLIEETILKIAVLDFVGAEMNSYLHFRQYEDEYKVVVSGPEWLDVTNLSANKGVAIERIQERLGISKEETMVFGDFLNDLEMMQAAVHSYAMKNAHPDILKISRYVTDFDNNENGVVETIKKQFRLEMN